MKTKNQQPYFPHDANSRNSDKMIRLRLKHGVAGYGVYYMLMERLRGSETFQADLDYDVLAYDLQCDRELIKSVIEDFGLFETIESEGKFHSIELSERMEVMLEAKRKRQEAARRAAEARWGKTSVNADEPIIVAINNDDILLKSDTKEETSNDLEKEIGILLRDSEWTNAIKKEFKLSDKQLSDYVEAFRLNCIRNCMKDGHKSMIDAAKHCCSYIRKMLEDPKSKTDIKKGNASPITEKLSKEETERLKQMDRDREKKIQETPKPMNSRLVMENTYRNKGYEPNSCQMRLLYDEEWLRNNPPTHPEWINRFPNDTKLEDVEKQLEMEAAHYGDR